MKMLISKLNLNETFICNIWDNQAYYSGLKTTDGKSVEILDRGQMNPDAGPDYIDARISIDNRIYCGSIEIHRECGDWHRHSHRRDSKYAEVILHVALFNDSPEEGPAKVRKSREIPTVILSDFLNKSIRDIWKELIKNKADKISLPCFPSVLKVSSSLKRNLISSLSLERLQIKRDKIAERIEHLSESCGLQLALEQTLFEYVCEALGYSKNKNQFIRLARSLNVECIKLRRLSLVECDSVIFGMAGFLQGLRFKDQYVEETKCCWENLRTELNLPQMNSAEWNFFRLRPVNFPTLRLAYASGLLHYMTRNNLSNLVNETFLNSSHPYRELSEMLKRIFVSEYWQRHYHFGRKKKVPGYLLGDQRISDIIENVLIPFSLSTCKDLHGAAQRITDIYTSMKLKGGKSLLTRWLESETGFKIRTLSDEQGMIQLHKEFCLKNKCDKCEIGREVFGEKVAEEPIRIIIY
ncbi:MAG: DUF2851 family protein [Ignavibacteria bacterium]|nr:DUF2851 family protein [Ignavibacteria bacterium]